MTGQQAVTEQAELERLQAAAEDRRDVHVRWRPTGSRRWAQARFDNVPAWLAGGFVRALSEELDPPSCTCPPDDEELED